MGGLFSFRRRSLSASLDKFTLHPTSDETNVAIPAYDDFNEPILCGHDSGARLGVELQRKEKVGCSGQTSNNGIAKTFGDLPTNSQRIEVEVVGGPTVTENEMKTLGPDVQDPEGPTCSSDSREDNTRETDAPTEEVSLINEPSGGGGDSQLSSEPVNRPIQLDDIHTNDSIAATEATNESGNESAITSIRSDESGDNALGVGPYYSVQSQINSERDCANLAHVGCGIYCFKDQPLSSEKCVYRGKQIYNDGLVREDIAVKLLTFTEYQTQKFKSYRREVRNMIDATNHSNVALFVHCGKIEGNVTGGFFVAMELCQSKTLADIDLRELSREERKNVFVHTCEGMKYLHEGGKRTTPLAHMDLKPSNILFSLKGDHAVVADFGLSRNVEKDVSFIKSTTSRYGGTLGWMPAELLVKSRSEEGSSFFLTADIFSLGLVGVYLLTGHHPFAKDGMEESETQWQANIENKAVPNSKILNLLEPLEKDLFEKMLSHDPTQRPLIIEVMRHCTFWTLERIRNFFKTLFGVYFRDKGPHNQVLNLDVFSKPLSTLEMSEADEEDKRTLAKIKDVISEHWLGKITELERKKAETDLVSIQQKVEVTQNRFPVSDGPKKSSDSEDFGDFCLSGMFQSDDEPLLENGQSQRREGRIPADLEMPDPKQRLKKLTEKSYKLKSQLKWLEEKASLVKFKLELDRESLILNEEETKLERNGSTLEDAGLRRKKEDFERKLKTCEQRRKRVKGLKKKYLNDTSLRQFLRYLRNYIEHQNYEELMEEVISAFPKLLPFLIEEMGQQLKEEHRKEYLLEIPRGIALGFDESKLLSITKPTTN